MAWKLLQKRFVRTDDQIGISDADAAELVEMLTNPKLQSEGWSSTLQSCLIA